MIIRAHKLFQKDQDINLHMYVYMCMHACIQMHVQTLEMGTPCALKNR